MADKRIDIDIKTNADTDGAKEAADEIKKVGDAAESVGSTTKALEDLNKAYKGLSGGNLDVPLQKAKAALDALTAAGKEGSEEFINLKNRFDEVNARAEKLKVAAAKFKELEESAKNAADGFDPLIDGQKRWIEAQEDAKAAADNVIEAIETDSEVTEENTELKQDAAEALEEYVKQAEDATEAFEDEAKAAKKMNAELSKIRAIQQAQLLGEFARGLGEIAKVAKDNGFPELAEGLREATTGLRTAATLIQGGLGISQLITQLGGLRAALASTALFLTGPVGVALVTAAAAFTVFRIAVNSASDEMDRFAEEAEKSVTVFGDIKQRSEEAVKVVIDGIEKEIDALDRLIDKRRIELDIIRLKANEQLAVVDAEAAILQTQVDAQQASGEISGEEAIIKRAKIQEDSIRKRYAIELEKRKEINAIERKQADEAEAAYQAQLVQITAIKEKFNEKPVDFTTEQLEQFKKLGDEVNRIRKLKESLTIDGIIIPQATADQRLEIISLGSLIAEQENLIKEARKETKIEYSENIKEAEKLLAVLEQTAEKEANQADDVQRKLLSEQTIAKTRISAELEVLKAATAITVQKKLQATAAKAAAESAKEEAKAAKEAEASKEKEDKDKRDELIRRGEVAEDLSGGIPAAKSLNDEIKAALLAAKTGPPGQETTPAEAAELTRLIAELIARLKVSENVQVGQGVDIKKLRVLYNDLRSQNKNNRTK